ncbi:hypothetical protein [Ramlibacter sp.]|uniref:hypothetical protein n=1 Tax=Ramlibacter sp. TaxID=1917967 RepID=UPI003D09C4E4
MRINHPGAGGTPAPHHSTSTDRPLRGFYEFVRGHLAVFNGLVLTAGSLAGLVNYFAPGMKAVSVVIYSAVAALATLMAVAALWPALVAEAVGRAGVGVGARPPGQALRPPTPLSCPALAPARRPRWTGSRAAARRAGPTLRTRARRKLPVSSMRAARIQ